RRSGVVTPTEAALIVTLFARQADLNATWALVRPATSDHTPTIAPAGYTEAGMRVYRHLVRLGVTQLIEAHHPDLRTQLGDEAWDELITAFVRQSAWTSHHYGDLHDEFLAFLARESA
ncbi:MAG: DNA-binding domain-containing protein, partial [Aquabacterium sp.]|nr:DNA-binding domain-containing protein [Aquabacterium sp.]